MYVANFKIIHRSLTKSYPQLFDYLSSQLVDNKTFAHRLPPTFIEQARGWADFRENMVFSDEHMSGIGNSTCSLWNLIYAKTENLALVASRTALNSMLSALQRIAFNGDPLQFMLIESTYQPFISLFHQTEMIKGHPELQAIRKSSHGNYHRNDAVQLMTFVLKLTSAPRLPSNCVAPLRIPANSLGSSSGMALRRTSARCMSLDTMRILLSPSSFTVSRYWFRPLKTAVVLLIV